MSNPPMDSIEDTATKILLEVGDRMWGQDQRDFVIEALATFASRIREEQKMIDARRACPWYKMHNANGDKERAQKEIAESILEGKPWLDGGLDWPEPTGTTAIPPQKRGV